MRVSGTDMYGEFGLPAFKIGTAPLVKVNVFRDVVRIAYSFKCWPV